jgi:hypothetical protein
VLLGREHHYCRIKKLTENIAQMFVAKDPLLLNSKYLMIDKKMTNLEAHKRMLRFCKVAFPPEQNQIDTDEQKF